MAEKERVTIRPEKHGVTLGDLADIVFLAGEPKLGQWLLFRGARQEVEIRITPSGQLRIGKVRRSGGWRATGWAGVK